MQNKLFATIAMIMIAMIGMTGFAAATQETDNVTVSIGDGNGTVTIPIMVDNVTNLGLCNVKLTFDPTIVNVTVADGEMDNTHTSNYDATNGNVHITAFQSGSSGLNDSVIIANVTFTPANGCSMGSCNLELTVAALIEKVQGTAPIQITHTVVPGEYTTTMINGDASGNRVVDYYDVLYIAQYVMTPEDWPIECPVVADVNGDGNVTLSDAMYLANYLDGDLTYSPLK